MYFSFKNWQKIVRISLCLVPQQWENIDNHHQSAHMLFLFLQDNGNVWI